MSAVWLPPPATMRMGSRGAVRYWVLWQRAQLKPTRSKPTVFFENPAGSSRPSSQGSPSDAYPPGPGR